MAAKKSFNLIFPLIGSIVINLGLIGLVFKIDSDLKDQTDVAAQAIAERDEEHDQTREKAREVGVLRELINGRNAQRLLGL